jgi:flavin-dependent dehydrogenase
MRPIVIVGTGIGGLSAARAMAGHEPVVLERSPAGPAIRAGLVLSPKRASRLGCATPNWVRRYRVDEPEQADERESCRRQNVALCGEALIAFTWRLGRLPRDHRAGGT